MSTPNPSKEAFERIQSAFKGLQTVQVVYLGLELGLFETLRAEAHTPETLAGAKGLHLPYLRVWMQTAVAFGILAYADEMYRLAPGMETVLLDTNHPRYVGGFARGFMTYLADDFNLYPDAFRDGHVRGFGDHGEEFSEWVSRLTHPMQRLVVGKILPEHVGAALQTGIDILDVGCGAGQFLFKLAAQYPNCRFTGIDGDPHGIVLARRAAADQGLSDRITFRHIYGQDMTYQDQFDLVVMFEVLHELPVSARPGVMSAVYRALRPGGLLFILDETWSEDPRLLNQPEYQMSVLVQFSELVWGNVVYTESEQTRLLNDAGFETIERGDLGGTFTILTARK